MLGKLTVFLAVLFPLLQPVSLVVASASATLLGMDVWTKQRLVTHPKSRFWRALERALAGGGGTLGFIVRVLDFVALNRDRKPGDVVKPI
jgi:cytosine/uracil/thiamine/allantoin permease